MGEPKQYEYYDCDVNHSRRINQFLTQSLSFEHRKPAIEKLLKDKPDKYEALEYNYFMYRLITLRCFDVSKMLNEKLINFLDENGAVRYVEAKTEKALAILLSKLTELRRIYSQSLNTLFRTAQKIESANRVPRKSTFKKGLHVENIEELNRILEQIRILLDSPN